MFVHTYKRRKYGKIANTMHSSQIRQGLRSNLTMGDLEADWHAIRKMNLDQVNAAARRLIGDGRFHLAMIGPAQQILPQIKQRGEAAVFPARSTPDRWKEA